MRVLRIACRRSLGLYFAPLFLAIEALNLLGHGRGWTITWESASQAGATIMVLIGPLAAAVGAAEGVQLHRTGGAVLRAAGRRAQWRHAVLRFVALGVWVVGCHLAALVAITVMTAVRHRRFGMLDWAATGVSVEVLLAFLAVGVAVGVWVPRLVTPPVLAVFLYALVPVFGVHIRLVLAGAGQTPMLGEQPRGDLLAVQAVWFACAAGAALLLAGPPAPARAGGAIVLAAVMVWAGPYAIGLGPDTIEPQAHPRLSCLGTAPRVCASADLPESLAPLRRLAPPLAAASHRLAPDRPVHTVIGLSWIVPRPTTVAVGVDVHPPYVDPEQAAGGFAASLAGCWNELPVGAERDLDVTTRWLLHAAGLPGRLGPGLPTQHPPTTSAARAALARRRVACQ